jgi:hypothetical protein
LREAKRIRDFVSWRVGKALAVRVGLSNALGRLVVPQMESSPQLDRVSFKYLF